MYKNRLQELAQRSCFNLPAYSCIREGPDHAPRFKATVNFNGETFESPTFCSTLRQAEHAAAEVALNTLAKRGPSRALAARVLDETGVYKNLLQETAHRAGLNLPVYTTIRSGPGHGPNFSCTVEIAGMHFTGDPSRTKKQAQKNAAMAAWSALRKLSEHHLSSSTSSSFSLESKGNEEQEQVIIARVLASLHPSGSKNFSKSDIQLGWQKSTTTSLVSTQPTTDLYPMHCQHFGISSFSPEVALYQIWQQQQIMQQQNRLLALTIQPIIPSTSQIYPLMQSVFQPDHCLYFPARELASVPVGPKLSIPSSSPSFYSSNQIGPELNTGRSTLTIKEIQEEKIEDPPVCSFSNETRVLTPATEDESQRHGGSGSRSINAELGGEHCEKSECDSHWGTGSVHRPVNPELQNPSSIDSSVLRAHSQASSNRSFRPPAASSSSIVRTMCPTSFVGSRPQHVAPRLRTGTPRSPGIPIYERFGMIRAPTPLFMAPAVRIRSVVPVCSAPPRRSMAEVSQSKEKEDLKPAYTSLSHTFSTHKHVTTIPNSAMATATAAAATSYFFGTRLNNVNTTTLNNGRFHALLNFGKKKTAPQPPPKKKEVKVKPSGDRLVWFPNAEPPEWLDGSMIGDRGFDPFGFAKPAEYLQFDLDSLDQNLAKNIAGDVIGTRVEVAEVKPTPFQPYSEVFGIQRFRECELIHGRWAMLGSLGALAVEALTGVAWQDAGKVELVEGSSYLGLPLPFSLTTLIWIEVIVIGYIEFQRNAELDPEKRLYPGGRFFDPLGLANDPEEKARLQLAEIKHSRLAMVVFLIFAIQAAVTGKGPISFLATFNK